MDRADSSGRYCAMQAMVSVIIPAYKPGQYLAAAIESLLKQTYKDIEVIVVDDGTPGGVWTIVGGFGDDRLHLLRLEKNVGYGGAMAAGLNIARGTYIARADADDYSHPERLARQVEFLENHAWIAFVGTRRRMITPNGRVLGTTKWPSGAGEWIDITWDSLMKGERVFADPSVMAKKCAVETVGGWRNYQRSGMDVDLWLRLLERGYRGAVLREPLYFRRLHPEGLIFAENTSIRNRIVRELAEERVRSGKDAVMRGEVVAAADESTLKSWEVRRRQGSFAWSIGGQCMEKADFAGGLQFAVAAVRRCGVPGILSRGPARFFRGGWRGLRRIARVCARRLWSV